LTEENSQLKIITFYCCMGRLYLVALLSCLSTVTIAVSSTFHCQRLSRKLLMLRRSLSQTLIIVWLTSTSTQRYFVSEQITSFAYKCNDINSPYHWDWFLAYAPAQCKPFSTVNYLKNTAHMLIRNYKMVGKIQAVELYAYKQIFLEMGW